MLRNFEALTLGVISHYMNTVMDYYSKNLFFVCVCVCVCAEESKSYGME